MTTMSYQEQEMLAAATGRAAILNLNARHNRAYSDGDRDAWIATFRHSQALIWVFTTLLILFILLDIGVWQGVGPGQGITRIAGWEGIFCAFTAWYLAAATILNDTYGRIILPVGAIPKPA